MLEAFREQRLLKMEEELPVTFRRGKEELQEQIELVDRWRLRLTEALEQLKEMAQRAAADQDED